MHLYILLDNVWIALLQHNYIFISYERYIDVNVHIIYWSDSYYAYKFALLHYN